MSSKLGFYDLMNIAEQNAEQTAKVAKNQKFASFECPKPKKIDPKQKVLSDNIKKFLEKKKADEARLQEEENRKKAKLLELRSQDKKATKRVGQMLRMTKSANKSVLAEAKDCLEDSLVEQDGYQPDEDDYGYVSQHAAEYHKKMMEKYRALPTNKPPPTKTATGVPVPQAQSLKTSKSSEGARDTGSSFHSASDSPHKSKPKRPPPVNFDTLMKLALVNSKEPLAAPMPKPVAREEEKFEFGRPMTAKEKAEYLREKEARSRIERGIINIAPSGKPTAPKTAKGLKTNNPTPTASKPNNPVKINAAAPNPSTKSGPSIKPMNTSSTPKTPPPTSSSVPPAPKVNPGNSFKKPTPIQRHPSNDPPSASLPTKSANARITKPPERAIANSAPVVPATKNIPAPTRDPDRMRLPKEHKQIPKPSSSKFPKSDLNHRPIREPPPPQIRPKGVRLEDIGRGRENRIHAKSSRENHRDLGSQYSSTPKPKGRQIIDSSEEEEEEYDSEMDDFIDDSDVGSTSISDMIRNITGYDKRKYRDMSDDECMESNVWQQMREEQRSLRIGIQEDLEDIRREEEEKKQKMLKKRKH